MARDSGQDLLSADFLGDIESSVACVARKLLRTAARGERARHGILPESPDSLSFLVHIFIAEELGYA